MYNYGVLRVDSGEEARQHNEKLLGPNTLGIEITRVDFAAKCGLGNIDPQHGGPNPNPDSSAILDSLSFPLPPKGTTLVTIRPDADAFGAMAVLTARFEGKEELLRRELIEMIYLIDCLGPAAASRQNPKIQEYRPEGYAIQQISRGGPSWADPKAQVYAIMQVLTGSISRSQVEEIASTRKVNDAGELKFTVVMPDRAMLIETRGQYGFARQYGSARFPITIVCDFEYVMPGVDGYTPHKRWCIVRNSFTAVDIEKLKLRLNESEAVARGVTIQELEKSALTWGGPKNLVSSPQGKESALNHNEITTIVCEYVQ